MSLIYFILLLGGLIFFHELGHYVMARLSGVHVVTFSIGFGSPIVRWTRKGTEYVIAMIPLGGYVRLLGGEPGEEVPEELRAQSFMEQDLWRRFWIVAGGPLFNMILPFFVFFGLGLSSNQMLPAMVGTIAPGGPADKAGLQSGDKITRIGDSQVHYWWQLVDKISGSPGEELGIEYERGGERFEASLVPDTVEVVRAREIGAIDTVGRIQVSPDYALPIVWIPDGSIAHKSGLRTGDRVLAVGSQSTERWVEVAALLREQAGRPFPVTVLRAAESLSADARPATLELKLAAEPLTFQVVPESGLDLGIESAEFRVNEIEAGSPAEKSGLKVGDLVLELDGRAFGSWPYFERVLLNGGPIAHTLRVRRGGEILDLKLLLEERVEKTDIKIDRKITLFGASNRSLYAMVSLIPNEHRFSYAVHRMVNDSWDAIRMTVLGIAGLFVGKLSYKEMGGPIMIYNLASGTEKRGWEYFFRIMVILSINLGLINLFPIPVLDGGHIMFILLEAVRRKPISLRARQVATYVGLGLILMLMILVFKNDIDRNWDSIIQLFKGT